MFNRLEYFYSIGDRGREPSYAATLIARYQLRMKKVLAYLVIGAILGLAGCSFGKKDSRPRPSVLEKLPFVYKMTVQQGNIVTEEMIDRLESGMTKSQVRFLLGTPMLIDLFHTDRWDYTYTIRRGHDEMAMTRLTLLFEADHLVEVRGDLRPDPNRAAQRQPADLLVSVPDWEDERGVFALWKPSDESSALPGRLGSGVRPGTTVK